MPPKRPARPKNAEARPEPVKAGDSRDTTNTHLAVQLPGNLGSKIHTIRGVQVMLDEDLAALYGVEPRALNQAVKRNRARFPHEFCFQITNAEEESLRSQPVILETGLPRALRSQTGILDDEPQEEGSLRFQFGTLNAPGRGRHRKYLPHAFTEQGIAMLSAVLRSPAAVRVSIRIMQAFVEMRRALHANAGLFQRVDGVERRQIAFETETDRRFEQVFTALEGPHASPKQGIFYDGQVYDSHVFVSDLIRGARESIVLIDNYVDDTVLTMLAKRGGGVSAVVHTRTVTPEFALDLRKHNAQYPPVEVREFKEAHDRFLILDGETVYHLGASLKDLGKKWFAFSRMEQGAVEMLERLGRGIRAV
jgi:hypothetical protein